ncbi:acetate kinase [Bradyrhizobium sp. LM2.7]
MSDAVLVLNSGSSSIKFGLFELSGTDPALLCKGLLDEHETTPRLIVKSPAGEDLFEKQRTGSDTDSDHLFADVLAFIEGHFGGRHLRAVGHRIVHGGPDYSGPAELTEDVYAKLEALTPLAPLHQPLCLAPIHTIQAIRPALRQIACFDTAFHHGLRPPASRFAIPKRYEERGIRRYGFHGLSFEYVAGRLAEIAPELAAGRTIIAHLGNGASLCALSNSRSVDTTMGFTPLDGLVMGTRCGAIDPGVLLYLQQHEKMSAEAVQHLLYHECGLLGVSGLSADMRTLLASGEAAAREAIDLFTFRAAQGHRDDGDHAPGDRLSGLHGRHRRAQQGDSKRDRRASRLARCAHRCRCQRCGARSYQWPRQCRRCVRHRDRRGAHDCAALRRGAAGHESLGGNEMKYGRPL